MIRQPWSATPWPTVTSSPIKQVKRPFVTWIIVRS